MSAPTKPRGRHRINRVSHEHARLVWAVLAPVDQPGQHAIPADDLGPLIELLTAFADPDCSDYQWNYRCTLGDAGHVDLRIDVDPQKLTPDERHFILSFAAQLANWSHA